MFAAAVSSTSMNAGSIFATAASISSGVTSREASLTLSNFSQ